MIYKTQIADKLSISDLRFYINKAYGLTVHIFKGKWTHVVFQTMF